jgi:hypothetical protein
MGGAQLLAFPSERIAEGETLPSRSGRRHGCGRPRALKPHDARGERGRGEDGRRTTGGGRGLAGGTRYAVGPGMGLVANDGEGLGVTRVSAGGADDGEPPRADSRTAQARPSCHGCRFGDRIYVLMALVKTLGRASRI